MISALILYNLIYVSIVVLILNNYFSCKINKYYIYFYI